MDEKGMLMELAEAAENVLALERHCLKMDEGQPFSEDEHGCWADLDKAMRKVREGNTGGSDEGGRMHAASAGERSESEHGVVIEAVAHWQARGGDEGTAAEAQADAEREAREALKRVCATYDEAGRGWTWIDGPARTQCSIGSASAGSGTVTFSARVVLHVETRAAWREAQAARARRVLAGVAAACGAGGPVELRMVGAETPAGHRGHEIEIDLEGGLIGAVRIAGRVAALEPVGYRVLDYDVEGVEEEDVRTDIKGSEVCTTTGVATPEPLHMPEE